MAEFMAQSGKERTKRGHFLLDRCSHPQSDEHRFRVVVPEEFGRPIFTSVEWSGREDSDATVGNLVELRSLDKELGTPSADASGLSGLHSRFDGLGDERSTPVLRQVRR